MLSPAAEQEAARREWILRAVAAGMMAAGLAIVYAPGLQGPFLYDDIFEIENNPALTQRGKPFDIMFGSTGFPHRPLPYFSFAVNYRIHGLATTGYHVTNLTIHLLNGCLLWWIGKSLLCLWRGRCHQRDEWWAFGVAILWLVHPLASQPVAYIYQRIELLGATGILLANACFLQSLLSQQSAGWRVASVAAAAAAMLCKETAAAILPLIWLIDLTRRGPVRSCRQLLRPFRERAWFFCGLAATWVLGAIVVLLQRNAYRELVAPLWSPLVYLLNQPWVIGHYLRLAVLPVGQNFDYGWVAATDWVSLLSGAAVIGAVSLGVAWLIWSRSVAGLLCGTFLLLLAPSSSLIPVNDLAVEHRMYLPLAVPVAAAVPLLAAGCRRIWGRQGDRVTAALLVGLVVALGLTTHARVRVYQSLFTVWADAAVKNPENSRAQLWLGISLCELGESEAAMPPLRRAIELAPKAAGAARAYAWLAAIHGRRGELDASLAAAESSVRIDPKLAIGWSNLARVLVELERLPEARVACRRALTIDPQLGPARRLLQQLGE